MNTWCSELWQAWHRRIPRVGLLLAFSLTPLEKQPLTIAWDRVFDGGADFYRVSAANVTSSGDLIVGGVKFSVGTGGDPGDKAWLWKVRSGGETRPVDVDLLARQSISAAKADPMEVTSLSVGRNGNTDWIVADGGRTRLAIVDSGARDARVTADTLIPAGTRITRIIPLAHGARALLGLHLSEAFVLKLDSGLRPVWKREVDRGKTELFVDGVGTSDGGSVLVGNSGSYDLLRRGPSEVWLARYSATGDVTAEVSFEGRFGRIANTDSGEFVIVYDRSSGEGQNIWAEGLDGKLIRKWQTPILETPDGGTGFEIARAPGGGFLLVGGKQQKPYLAWLGDMGRVTGGHWAAGDRVALDYRVACDEKACFVACSTILTDGRARSGVRVLKVVAHQNGNGKQ